jgi:hypothetical protein
MNTRRLPIARVASSAVLAATLMVGAQAFVPSAFGCSGSSTSDCRTSTYRTAPSPIDLILDGFTLIAELGGVLLP